MNEYVPPPFTISRSGLFKSLRTPPPLKLVATKRPATISKQRILDDNLTSFVSPKQWSNHKPHLPTKTIENQKKRILDFTFSESVDKNKNRDRDRDRDRDLDLGEDEDDGEDDDKEDSRFGKRQRIELQPIESESDSDFVSDKEVSKRRRKEKKQVRFLDNDNQGAKSAIVAFGKNAAQRLGCPESVLQQYGYLAQPLFKSINIFDQSNLPRLPGDAPLGTEFYKHGYIRGGARGIVPRSMEAEMEADGIRPCALSMGDIMGTPLDIKIVQFDWAIELCAEIPRCMGTERVPQERYPMQKEVHDIALGSVMNIAFGEEGTALVASRYRRMFNIKPKKIVFGVIASRQCGKTYSISVLAMALMMAVPGITIAVVSTKLDVSKFVLINIKNFIAAYEQKYKVRILLDSDSEAKIKFSANKSTIKAMAGNPDSNRGDQSNMIIVDETQSTERRMLSQFVFPLLVRPNRVTCLMGTPSKDPSNHFTLIINARGVNGPMVDILVMALICPECQKKGVKTACEHRQPLAAAEANATRRASVGSLIAVIADEETVQAEMSGITPTKDNGAFHSKSIMFLFDRAAFNPTFSAASTMPPCVLVTVDPSFGGSSGFAIVISYPLPGKVGAPDKCVVSRFIL